MRIRQSSKTKSYEIGQIEESQVNSTKDNLIITESYLKDIAESAANLAVESKARDLLTEGVKTKNFNKISFGNFQAKSSDSVRMKSGETVSLPSLALDETEVTVSNESISDITVRDNSSFVGGLNLYTVKKGETFLFVKEGNNWIAKEIYSDPKNEQFMKYSELPK